MREQIPVYIFSNTYALDFHELSTPNDEQLLHEIQNLLASPHIQKAQQSSFTLCAKRAGDVVLMGADIHVDLLDILDERYYRVARCDGSTPTVATVVFCVPIKQFFYLSEYRLAKVLQEIYQDVWCEKKTEKPMNLSVSTEYRELKLQRRTFARRFRDIETLFYEFNAEVQHKKRKKQFECVFMLKEKMYDKIKRYEYRKMNVIKERR